MSNNLIVLKAGGPRTVVQVVEAVQIRQRFQKELSTTQSDCHELDISSRAWLLESLQALQPVLSQVVCTLRTLKIDDIIASLPTAEGLASLEYLAETFATAPLLTTVNVNDNAVGTRGIAVLRPLLQNPAVTNLSLENCGLAEADGASLKDILRQNHLQSLSVGRNQMGVGGAEHIGALVSGCTQLRSLSYAGSRPLKPGSAALCRGLAAMSAACGGSGGSGNTLLHTLDLNDCCLGDGDEGDDPLTDLCKILRNSPCLHTLVLRDGELQVAGLHLVLQALCESGAALTTLDLGAIGELGKEGGILLRNFLFTTSSRAVLQQLMLDTNELGDAGVAAVAAGAAACINLQTLNLEANEIENAGAYSLVHNHIPALLNLYLEDNLDFPAVAARKLQAMYINVKADEDLPDDEDDEDIEDDADVGEDEDNDVDALAAKMKTAHL